MVQQSHQTPANLERPTTRSDDGDWRVAHVDRVPVYDVHNACVRVLEEGNNSDVWGEGLSAAF